MEDISTLLVRWQISPADAREQIYRAKTPRERERWHALWLLARGWSAAQVAQALERDPHTIGDWLTAFAQVGPNTLAPSSVSVSSTASRIALHAPRAIGMLTSDREEVKKA